MKTLILIFVLLATTCLYSTIINVPGDQPTIQAGINVAVDTDTVLVQPGTYMENINYNGKLITVASLFLTTQDTTYISQTIIDGDSFDTVVKFENGEDPSTLLTGFTITNGYANYVGGIYCDNNSSPSLVNVTITGNNADDGGGIGCYYSSPTITNNTINGNSANDEGGGIHLEHSNPTISDNTINGNTVGNYGGGISSDEYSSPTISNNTISGNTAGANGGGIGCCYSSPTITNNTISGNTATNGGGISCWDSNPVITNTIFWADSAPNGPEISLFGASSPVITYCNVQGGWAGEANIDDDPLFADPQNGDFHLTWANFPIPDTTMSPCIDAGSPESLPDPDGTIVDIGAFYFDQNQQGVEDISILKPSNILYQNYPNPFNPETTISYQLPENSEVELAIYNLKGQKVKTLVNELLPAGQHSVVWDGKDDNGKSVSSGIYFYKLKTGNFEKTKKMILMK